ncbi:acetyltransferase [Pantoea ananatis]|uniref:GNAT family N-acetyltransferase n=1 Tax=Pantoea ananas TaxID=553 RepID=A0A8A4KQW2_PANAN|nr:GNAT family N-acetyltransferase [Pantoea ananatis]MDC7872192.1 acetyltransferase [Pantoea ananatis]QTC48526.1 GNAT family N-acetyltransferase [Pantoea ananatis]
MVSFRSMTEEEYSAYLEYFIPDYAIEIASNYRMSKSDSLTMARQEISKLLAEGVNTHGQILLSIFSKLDVSERHVGYLWYKPDAAMCTVFIYDFHIFNSFQGEGLGKQALRTFEEDLQDKGFKEIRLRVAGDNARALHVYESSGFGVTGINMSKAIVR